MPAASRDDAADASRRYRSTCPTPIRPPLSAHVHLAHVDSCHTVADAVHDCAGLDVSAQPDAPILLIESRVEDNRTRASLSLHEVGQEVAERLVWPIEQPLVNRIANCDVRET